MNEVNFCNYTLCANLFHTRGARGGSGLNRTLGFRAPRPLPSVAGAKPKMFLTFLLFFGGGCGGSRQKMERKFLVLLRRYYHPNT